MKTLKITPQVHEELVDIQAKIYREQKVKLTLNEIINALIIVFNRSEKDGTK